jgi:hypothetical protein
MTQPLSVTVECNGSAHNLNLDIRTYTSTQPFFVRGGIACLFYLEMASATHGTVCVHEEFWKHLSEEAPATQETIKTSLIPYLVDQHSFDTDPAHPFRGAPDAFKAYCEVRYATLNRYQLRIVEPAIKGAVMTLLSDPSSLAALLQKAGISAEDKNRVLKQIVHLKQGT